MDKTLWMIGHSNHKWPKFLSLLTQHGIEYLVDVRSSPRSRFCPWFNANQMEGALYNAGIRYAHAPIFGGKIPQRPETLRPLLDAFLEERAPHAAMMCSEARFEECHRHYLLAPVIIELGYQIIQIQPDGSTVIDTGPTKATLQKMAAFIPKE